MGQRTFIKADFNVTELVASTLILSHEALNNVELKIETMMVLAPRNKDGQVTGSAIVHGGYRCAGRIRITKLEERVAGRGDAVMWLDGDRWKAWNKTRQRAVIDHELTHLELIYDAEGKPDRDDSDRPRIRIVPHDFHVGWFHSIAKRYGEHSLEVEQAQSLDLQMYFPGFTFSKKRKR